MLRRRTTESQPRGESVGEAREKKKKPRLGCEFGIGGVQKGSRLMLVDKVDKNEIQTNEAS